MGLLATSPLRQTISLFAVCVRLQQGPESRHSGGLSCCVCKNYQVVHGSVALDHSILATAATVQGSCCSKNTLGVPRHCQHCGCQPGCVRPGHKEHIPSLMPDGSPFFKIHWLAAENAACSSSSCAPTLSHFRVPNSG